MSERRFDINLVSRKDSNPAPEREEVNVDLDAAPASPETKPSGDEDSDFAMELRNASLVPEGIPDNRPNRAPSVPAPQPAPVNAREWRMSAYYYSFGHTGADAIDRILSAVACAGKAYHHTDCWTDETTPYEHLRGNSPAEWIQNAADDAASQLASKEEEHEREMLKVIDERDKWEEKLSEIAVAAECEEEWSNRHEHGDCIVEKLAQLRAGLGNLQMEFSKKEQLVASKEEEIARLLAQRHAVYEESNSLQQRAEAAESQIEGLKKQYADQCFLTQDKCSENARLMAKLDGQKALDFQHAQLVEGLRAGGEKLATALKDSRIRIHAEHHDGLPFESCPYAYCVEFRNLLDSYTKGKG